MAVTLGELHRISVEEYIALAEVGDLDRTELIEGLIFDMTPEGMGHADSVEDIYLRLVAMVGRRAHMAGSIRLGEGSMWDPDVWVEREGSDRSTGYVSAADVDLAIEVSRSSLSRDLGSKLRGYAAAGVPAYWVVEPDLGGRALIHTEPEGERYQRVEEILLHNGYRDLPVERLFRAG